VVTVPGHLHRVAESRAAAIMTGRPGMNTIMGYRPGDAERERSLAGYFAGTRSMILAAHCGIVPERVDRERSLLSCQLYPAGPDSLKEYYGIAEPRRVSSAAPGIAVRVPW
jgi:hypothetical protein